MSPLVQFAAQIGLWVLIVGLGAVVFAWLSDRGGPRRGA